MHRARRELEVKQWLVWWLRRRRNRINEGRRAKDHAQRKLVHEQHAKEGSKKLQEEAGKDKNPAYADARFRKWKAKKRWGMVEDSVNVERRSNAGADLARSKRTVWAGWLPE